MSLYDVKTGGGRDMRGWFGRKKLGKLGRRGFRDDEPSRDTLVKRAALINSDCSLALMDMGL